MAHVRKIKLKKGVAHRVYYSIDGKKCSRYFPAYVPYASVKQFAHEVELKRIKGDISNIIRSPTLGELKDLYQQKRAMEVKTWREIDALEILIRYLGRDININKITHFTLHDYRDWLLAERMIGVDVNNFKLVQRKRRGVNRELHFLRIVFRWAYKNDIVEFSVFDKVSFYRTSEAMPDTLTKDEMKAFYKALPRKGQLRLAFWMIRYTGLRRAELLALRWGDLDLNNSYIHLYQTKNRNEELIPIHPKLLRVLKWIRHRHRDEHIITLSKWYLSQGFRRAMNKAGLKDKKSSVHILRHTLGKNIMENDLSDVGERTAQEMLRHKSRAMTRHYTKIARENLKKKISDYDL